MLRILPSDDIVVRTHNAQLVLKGVLIFAGNDKVECISHDSNKHAEHHYKGHESCQEEEYLQKSLVRMLRIAVELELAKDD